MKYFSLLLLLVALGGSATARDWKVQSAYVDPKNHPPKVTLSVHKEAIVIPAIDGAEAITIKPADVIAIWYDNKAYSRNAGQKWWDKMNDLCKSWCSGDDISLPLTLAAIGGAGYLVTEPFTEFRHFVNIRYKSGDKIEVATLRTNWFDHFWLMTDLSKAVGHKWLNLPMQRAKLFWSWADYRFKFKPAAIVGSSQLENDFYDAVLWDDRSGRGILMLFERRHGRDNRDLYTAVPVEISAVSHKERVASYCGDGNVTYLQTVQLGKKVAIIPSAIQRCSELRDKQESKAALEVIETEQKQSTPAETTPDTSQDPEPPKAG